MVGKFVTIEGCEGVGKSTQIKLLQEYMQTTSQEAIFTREPGGTEISERIRTIILSETSIIHPLVEAYLFASARADHMLNTVLPALELGKNVFCDRFIDSSLSYQGIARDLGVDVVLEINKHALCGRTPDCTIFLDMRPENSWRRQKGKSVSDDRMEHESDAFHNKVYNGFIQIRNKYPDRYISIVPQENKQETHILIINALRKKGYIK
ncbi:MAG: dTMP kinase [Christensenellaceae bacterium]|jgi:dTMP kinase|nr:dTMP kinase [Christensenellaceae bacterium]